MALAVAAALALLVVAPAHAAFPGENGRLAYTFYDYESDIRRVCAAQSQCFTGDGGAGSARWSPNGARLVIESYTGIFTVDPDGSNETRLTLADYDINPSWSPDGRKISFVRTASDGNHDIYVMNADGTGLAPLLVTPSDDEYESVWSPDGRKIAFDRDSGDIFVMNADGSAPINLTTGLAAAFTPDWSPDGTWIAFQSTENIYKMRPDGSQVTQLTHDSAPTWNWSPAWSPDGTKIAFWATAGTTSSKLDVMNADGTGRTTVAQVGHGTDPAEGIMVDWQPVIRGYPRPKGASPMRISLVPAAQACTSPNDTHGAPLAFPSCSPVVPSSSTLAVSFGELKTKSTGAVKLSVNPGTNTNPDDADVNVALSITNVMNASDGSDYTGELRLELPLRITDKANTPNPPGGGGYGTVSDTSIFATAPCTGTAETTIGSTCSLTTTIDTVLPSTVHEGLRAIWALGQVKVHDGGADGDADTAADNTLFATQGLFVP